MHRIGTLILLSLLCACEKSAPPDPNSQQAVDRPSPADAPAVAPTSGKTHWDLQASGEGSALALLSGEGTTVVRLFCASGKNSLLVNVPAFRPIGSEERLSFGSGGDVVALVADSRGDAQRGGVSGGGKVPSNLDTLIGGGLSVSYGAQTSGPHPAPPQQLTQAFVAACRPDAASEPPSPQASATASPCLMQGGERLEVTPLRVVGTEPFWGAKVEGRCVTYSTPDDQQGTRVWTRYAAGGGGGGSWSGNMAGKPFTLRVRKSATCSDGMSGKSYPMTAELTVQGEQRRGCAEPR